MGTKLNLTIEHYANVVAQHAEALAERMRERLDALRSLAAPILDQRNRVLAHIDRPLAFGDSEATPLARPTDVQIDEIIAGCEAIIDKESEHFSSGSRDWNFAEPRGGASRLLKRLDEAEQAVSPSP